MEAENISATTADDLTRESLDDSAAVERKRAPKFSAPLEVRIERNFREVAELREQWDEAVAELGGSIYLSYEWCRTWWEFYGADKELRLFLFSVNGKLVSVVPLYIDRIGFKPFQFGVARLLGANIPPKAFNPPIHPDWAEPIREAILGQLLEHDRCDLISIGPVCETCGFLSRFATPADPGGKAGTRVSRERVGVHTVFQLPKSIDEFFERMDKDERKKRKYEMRLLAKEESISRDVVTAPEKAEAEFESFADQHAEQWSGKGKLGHFGSWPRGRKYNAALVRALARGGRVRFVRILADGQVISNQFAFVFGATWYWELPARVMDRKWNRFSLGTSGFFGLAQEAIQGGATLIEGGIAHYDYKQKLGGTEYGLEVLRFVADRYGSKLRTRLYCCLRSCLRFAYHKIWYARVAPRMPALFRRPIWTFWLRLDF